jgi:hypothetical protein
VKRFLAKARQGGSGNRHRGEEVNTSLTHL